MRRLRLVGALLLVVGVVFVPTAAQAHECATIEGDAFFDFGTANEGVAELYVDGEFQVVEFFSTGARWTSEFTVDIRFVFFFDQGTLVIIEHSVSTPIGDGVNAFSSKLDIRKGGSGGLHWHGIADVNAGVADIQDVAGEICFDR